MAKLFTKHDPFHLHATLGFLALCHFACRWFLIFKIGSAFVTGEPLFQRLLTVSIHFWLPLVSLILPVPQKRNLARPMIWPEFRIHSLLFATRHVVACMACMIYQEQMMHTTTATAGTQTRDDGQEWWFHHRSVMTVLLLLWNQIVLSGASLVTRWMGSASERTTNAMPYPLGMEESKVSRTKTMYRESQFQATAMVCVVNPTLAFMPLLAIQIAPFLMTLVRKNLSHAGWHHCVYAWALWFNFPAMVAILMMEDWKDVMWTYLAYWFFSDLRWKRGWGKHKAWLVAPLAAHLVMAVCHTVSFPLKSYVPSLWCPRIYWLVARSLRSAIMVAWENQHILFFPSSYHRIQKGRKQFLYTQIESTVLCVGWILGKVCDSVFFLGIALSGVMMTIESSTDPGS